MTQSAAVSYPTFSHRPAQLAGTPAPSMTPGAAPSRGVKGAAPLPTRITRYRKSVDEVPVDFFADPDGSWEFASLVEMAGFNPEHPGACVGALTQAFDGYEEGAAVITEVGVDCRYVAIAELPRRPARSDSAPQRGSQLSDSARSDSARSDSARSDSARDRRPHRAA